MDPSSLECIRPVLHRAQIKKAHLFQRGELIIYPGAKVSFDFLKRNPHPPHEEDYIFRESSIEFEGATTERNWKRILQKTAFRSFHELFPNIDDRYVPPDSPGPSIGTFLPSESPVLSCYYYTKTRPRMRIIDHTGLEIQRIAVTDLAFSNSFDYALKKSKGDCEKVIKKLNSELSERDVYLRLGLARPWYKIPEPYSGWCALQVNGIHTFPDLYDGDYAEWIY
jgi:hypothetical protein